ncbi:MAG: hypothetical protein D6761_10210 [Candidatus Dadabacteria bacterium]|nr:MAG: hypothetical protein D6761_10210 [Candidatus Dadabacteria bacterium]
MRSLVPMIVCMLMVTSCGRRPIVCSKKIDYRTKDGIWAFTIPEELRFSGARPAIGLPPDDPSRIPFMSADEVTVTIDRGTLLREISGSEALQDYRVDRVELYDGQVTFTYMRDGKEIREVYQLTRAEIRRGSPDNCE